MGLRKINICFINDLTELSSYFTSAAFNINDVIKQFNDYDCSASNIVTILNKDNYRINYVRNIQKGVMQQADGKQKNTYQIVVDADVFKEGNRDLLPLLSDKTEIEKILRKQNTIEFEIFIKSLSETFVEALMQEEFQSDVLRGVN